jgi:hypothetical protein
VHHRRFVKVHARTSVSYIHIWYGRSLLVLAFVNGGLGLQLARDTVAGKIVYSVVAGLVGLGYLGTIIYTHYTRQREALAT